MGSYSADSKVIRIHPALDQPSGCPGTSSSGSCSTRCSTTCTAHGAARTGGAASTPPEFIEPERKFYDIQRAQRWEDENLEFLLRRSP